MLFTENKKHIESIYSLIDNIKTSFSNEQFPHLLSKYQGLKEKDEIVNQIIKENLNTIITLNIGGKIFQILVPTLLSVKDTLFYQMVCQPDKFQIKSDNSTEWFFDRASDLFDYILDYVRYKSIDYSIFTIKQLVELKEEANFYNIWDMVKYFESRPLELKLETYDTVCFYEINGNFLGNTNLESLDNKDLTSGFALRYPGNITFTLNYVWNIQCIKYGNFISERMTFSNDCCKIQVSEDNKIWREASFLPCTLGKEIITLNINKKNVKYISLTPQGNLGIGYFKVIPE